MNDFIPNEGNLVGRAESDFSVTEKYDGVVVDSETKLKNTENFEDSIRHALMSYDIGQKLRQLRLRKKIALVDLGKHTGLSASMLSQLETGKLIPTLPTLARIAMVFDVGLEHFFGTKRGQRRFAVVRREEGIRFSGRAAMADPSYFFECLSFATQGKVFEVYLAEFPPQDAKPAAAHRHDGVEFV